MGSEDGIKRDEVRWHASEVMGCSQTSGIVSIVR